MSEVTLLLSKLILMFRLGLVLGKKTEILFQRHDLVAPHVTLGENFTDYSGQDQCLFRCVLNECESFLLSYVDGTCMAVEDVDPDPVRAKGGHGISMFTSGEVKYGPHLAIIAKGDAGSCTDFSLSTNISLGANWLPEYTSNPPDILNAYGLVHGEGFVVCNNGCKYLPFGGTEWEVMAEQMAEPRRAPASVMLEKDVLWVLGGTKGSGTTRTKTTELFQGGTWTTSVDLPNARFGPGAVKFPGVNTVLVFGGVKGVGYSKDAFTYTYPSLGSFDQGAWTTVDSLAVARSYMGVGVVINAAGNPIAVAVGGVKSATAKSDAVETFDLTTGLWTQHNAFDSAIRGPMSIVIDNRLWLFGGQLNSGNDDKVMVYDHDNDQWDQVAVMQDPASLGLVLRYNG